jgi:hypothetical protein
VFGLPVLTWATLTVAMISVRLLTGSDLQVQSQEGLHVVSLCGILLAGFWVAFAVFILNWPPLPTVGVYLLATASYVIIYKRVVLPETDLPVTT